MEEINLNELLKYFLGKWHIFVIVMLLAAILGTVYFNYFKVPLYYGTTTLILVQENTGDSDTGVTQGDLSINEMLVTTYSEIIKSRSVLEEVIESLDLDMTIDDLQDMVAVTSVSDTYIIEITVSDDNAKEAANIANKIATVFQKEITDIYNLKNISIIDKAIASSEPYNMNYKKDIVIYVLIAFVLVCAVVFVVFYFDNSVKNAKEIEERLNLPVFGEIPLVDMKKGARSK